MKRVSTTRSAVVLMNRQLSDGECLNNAGPQPQCNALTTMIQPSINHNATIMVVMIDCSNSNMNANTVCAFITCNIQVLDMQILDDDVSRK